MHNKTAIYPSVVDVVVDSKLQYFKNSLESLVVQTVTDFELVLVIGYPGTETLAYLDEWAWLPFDLVKVQEPPRDAYPARAAANNMGMDVATGDIYIGTQDDVIFPPNWVENHIKWQARDDGPWFVYNRLHGAVVIGDDEAEDEFWGRISNPRHLPIVDRWKYASGHGFSLPMSIAKTLRHNEKYCGFWGFEDLAFSFDAHRAGCKLAIDMDTAITHQPHGARADEKWNKSPEDFWKWLSDRSRNRRLFYELNGFDPEYGIIKDEFGLPGELNY